MGRKEWINIIIIIILLGIGFYKYQSRTYSEAKAQLALDTLIEISITTKSKNVEQQLTTAFEMVKTYEAKFSYYHPQSMLSTINNSQGTSQPIDNDFYEILHLAEHLYYESNHLYDVSIGNLIDLWDFSAAIVPQQTAIDSTLARIGFEQYVAYNDSTISLTGGVRLNFGSLCKGYIIDKVMEYIISQDPIEAQMNAGGDIRFYSKGNRKWKVGVQHPRDSQKMIARLSIPDRAVVTSGDYERFFMADGERYHHILNPLTGYPAKMTVSVTIISPTAFIADALSTAAFVMNPNDAIALVKKFPNTDAIILFYDFDGDLHNYQTANIQQWSEFVSVRPE